MSKVKNSDMPGLFQTADTTSNIEQKKYFTDIWVYLVLLVCAASVTFVDGIFSKPYFKIISTILFLLTLLITIYRKVSKPDSVWYNGRAVAESVKTRTWRWMMGSEPYSKALQFDQARKLFIDDLKDVLKANKSLMQKVGAQVSLEEPITNLMLEVRSLNLNERFLFYKENRITDQALWYSKEAKKNKLNGNIWFWITVGIHAVAIILLLCSINDSTIKLPIGVFSSIASSALTWSQSKKYGELAASYSLTAHEIILLKAEIVEISDEEQFSDFVLNCENAFSREHTQWVARKTS